MNNSNITKYTRLVDGERVNVCWRRGQGRRVGTTTTDTRGSPWRITMVYMGDFIINYNFNNKILIFKYN